jgi:colanic acid/amylovoran biosynthesis glycosyltransferase
VHRFAMRGWDAHLPDSDDLKEMTKTKYLLKRGALPLIKATILTMVATPVRFSAALRLAFKHARPSDRPFPVHLIYLMEACWLSRRLKVLGLRHLHVHFGTNPPEVALLVQELSHIQFSFTVHGPEEFFRAPLIHLAEKIRQAAFIVAVSSFGRSQLLRLVNQACWKKIHVVHGGLDRVFFQATASAFATNRLLCFGRLNREKGHLLLINASRLAKDGHKFELVFVGDGEMRPEIESLIAHHALEDRVPITGWADGEAVRQHILASRALILASFAEGLPVVLMEAMALGRLVLTTYVAGIPELVIHGETGWLVPAGNEDALAMQACLAADAETLNRMGEAGRQRVLMRHDIDHEAGKLCQLFETYISREPNDRLD